MANIKKDNSIKYWSPKRIKATKAKIKIVFGMRSNGKTTGCLLEGLEKTVKTLDGRHEQTVYLRRWEDEVKPKNDIASLYNGILQFWNVEKKTKGKYNTILYKARKFYFAKVEEGKTIDIDSIPICYCLAVSQNEHYKSLSYPDVTTIVFDEFLSENHQYLPNEFKRFTSILSTVIRSRTDVDIYMCGNTVDLNSIYWQEFRIVELFKKMKEGDIVHYKPKNRQTDIALEWAAAVDVEGRVLNVYTDFDTANSAMINKGEWDTDNYPHLPYSYERSDIVFTFFIQYNFETYQAEVIRKNRVEFIYIHRKTTPIHDEDKDLIYSTDFTPARNRYVNLFKPELYVQQKIVQLFNTNKVFYQDNIVGDAIDSYLKWCKQF